MIHTMFGRDPGDGVDGEPDNADPWPLGSPAPTRAAAMTRMAAAVSLCRYRTPRFGTARQQDVTRMGERP